MTDKQTMYIEHPRWYLIWVSDHPRGLVQARSTEQAVLAYREVVPDAGVLRAEPAEDAPFEAFARVALMLLLGLATDERRARRARERNTPGGSLN